ncbi:MAG: methyltransferase domain-containing protein [Nostocoides sp.]
MRWWDAQVVPRATCALLSGDGIGRWRAKACSGAFGNVLEFGFGGGHNLPYYGPAVTSVQAVEPSDLAWQHAGQRIRAFGAPVIRVGLDGSSVPVPDDSVDVVVSTWTMCTIPDLPAALAEARRVLRPGGRLSFVEHSVTPHPGVARTQRLIQPVWGRLAGGCHVDRDIVAYVAEAGFDIGPVSARYAGPTHGIGRLAAPWSWFVSGAVTEAGAVHAG